MATLRSPGVRLLTTRPPMLIVPPSSGSRPAINRRTVLLPQPLGPTIAISSALRTCRVRCETALEPSLKTRETSSSRTSAMLQPPPDQCPSMVVHPYHPDDPRSGRLPAELAGRSPDGGHRVAGPGLGGQQVLPGLAAAGDPGHAVGDHDLGRPRLAVVVAGHGHAVGTGVQDR